MLSFFRRNNRPTPSMKLDPFEEARRDPCSLGNLAIERGYITSEDLEQALKVQKERLRIGELLVEMGKLNQDQLDELLMEQKIKRGEAGVREELKFQRLRKRNRLIAMKEKFAEATGDSRTVTASITRTLLTVENGE